ncbi:FMN-binding negative transcriptional regulator [Cellulomonas sp. ATA003]|uniref:FMN-binding negative transcriptional regulator n=1 Tax=Cellulomonas sp. ATA003 TaxID=3073064 RepID=UPI0028734935|nr:FMN-binding negative transcriptional regulator [Cellulomonas sp. ATA003]WNB85457.1 FMN-binding negative transcriptional regulator [Cellulomonas sp. ATA003]
MIDTPAYRLDDDATLRDLIRAHGWATLVSHPPSGLVASHVPVLLEDATELTVVGHLGRPDDVLHALGSGEVLVVVAGEHGYVSPGWYGYTPALPTWNYVVAHLYGVPEVLDADETLRVLSDTVDRYERVMPEPVRLPPIADHARRVARGAVGFRLRVTRVQAKAKLSQDKPPEVVARVVAALETDPTYANPALAARMRVAHGCESDEVVSVAHGREADDAVSAAHERDRP